MNRFLKAKGSALAEPFLFVPGGERGIRTPDRLLTYTRFPGVRLKPLIHLSGGDAHYSKLLDARPYPG